MRTGEWVVAENWRLCSTTLVCGVGGELEDENWRPGSTTLVRRVAGDWEDENWRLGSTTLVWRVVVQVLVSTLDAYESVCCWSYCYHGPGCRHFLEGTPGCFFNGQLVREGAPVRWPLA